MRQWRYPQYELEYLEKSSSRSCLHYRLTNMGKMRHAWQRRIILLVVGAFLLPVGSLISGIGWTDRQNVIMAMNGELIPFTVDMSKPFDILLSADVTFQYSSLDLANGFNLTTIFPFNINFTDDQFQIQFINNEMFVSANIRNSDNTLIAQIVNNEWKTVNPDTLLFWDRNYNAYAFEIIGSNNIPTLQVIMVGPNKIQIGGLFYTRTGSIYIAQAPGGAVMYVNVGDEHQEYGKNILRIFRYPALTNPSNLGKMLNPIYYSSDPLSESTWMMVFGIVMAALGGIMVSTFGYEKYKASKVGRKKGKGDTGNKRRHPEKYKNKNSAEANNHI